MLLELVLPVISNYLMRMNAGMERNLFIVMVLYTGNYFYDDDDDGDGDSDGDGDGDDNNNIDNK